MAAETTDRLGIYVWSSDGDEFNRDQMNTSHEALEDRVAQFFVDSAEPLKENQYARSFFLNTSNNVIYYSNTGESGWQAINATASAVSIAPGSTNSAGTATTLAKSDHTHALPNWGSAPPSVTTSSSAGSATTFARSDHTHNLADSVVVEGKIANNAVTNSKIVNSAVSTLKLEDGAVTKAKIAPSQQLPTGMIAPFAGSVAPEGWVLCDGQSYSQTDSDYAPLFAVISTNYGSGGAGTFRVPDLRNRVPQGAGTTALAGTGGGTASISSTHLPSHSHDVGTLVTASAGAHTHSFSGTTSNGGGHSHTFTFVHDHNFVPNWDLLYRNPASSFYFSVVADSGTFGTNEPFGRFPWAEGGTLPRTTDPVSNHTHTYSGTVGSAGAHTHTITGSTAAIGNGTPLPISPSHLGVNYIIKL